MFNCAYGVGKAAMDRMAADCGTELRSAGVAMVSLMPGPVRTEEIMTKIDGGHEMSGMKERFLQGKCSCLPLWVLGRCEGVLVHA